MNKVLPLFVSSVAALVLIVGSPALADDHDGHHHHVPRCAPNKDDFPVFDNDGDDLGCPRPVPISDPVSSGEHEGYCLSGIFLDLLKGQPSTDPAYTGAVPANFLEGVGITCDVLPGFVATGLFADGSGTPNAGGEYPYYMKG